MTSIRAGNYLLGAGHPCFLVAEVGINHNGDLGLARRMIEAAAEAGANCVKFQNYETGDFISDRSLQFDYTSQGRPVRESQYDLFKRCELSRSDLRAIQEHCLKCGVVFQSTPTSEAGVQALVELGSPLLKNGSDYLVHLSLIGAMARTGLPTVLSTGMATVGEIDEAVRAFHGAGGKELILLHCTSSYPTPAADVHLRKIPALAAAFGCPVGFSDHTFGVTAALGAVAFGACLIEKHFTIDRNLPGPDHHFSSDAGEFRQLVENVRHLEACVGEAAIGPTPTEEFGRENFRLSCVAAGSLPRGHVLAASDIAFRRPGTGLPPKAIDWLVGRILLNPIDAGAVFDPGHFVTMPV